MCDLFTKHCLVTNDNRILQILLGGQTIGLTTTQTQRYFLFYKLFIYLFSFSCQLVYFKLNIPLNSSLILNSKTLLSHCFNKPYGNIPIRYRLGNQQATD